MRIIGVCLATLVGISGCGGEGGTGPDNEVVSVALTPATIDTLFSFGETVQLAASPRNAAGAAVSGGSVTFESSATNVATVSQTGLITSAGNGSATVTATASSVSASLVVRVRQKLVSLLGLPATASVAVARTTALSATPADARGGAIVELTPGFVSSDEGVARVNANGVVTGVAIGSTTITTSVVSPSDGTKTATTVVTVMAAPPATATVTMSADRFMPDTVAIAINGTVSFVNGSGEFHDVDFGTPSMRIQPFDSGQRSLVFPTAGTLRYHCNLHVGMEATVVVS